MSGEFSINVFGIAVTSAGLTMVGGVVAWFIQHWRDNAKQKVQKTVELLLPFTTSDRLAEGNVLMARLIASATMPRYGEDPQMDRSLIDLLDYYEFLCELLERDVLDEDTVLSLRGKLIGSTFGICRSYIDDLRASHGRGVYEAMERIVNKHSLRRAVPVPVATDSGST